jgi:hypothetical protein
VPWRDRRANARAKTAGRLVDEMQALSFEQAEDEYRRAFLFEGVSWRNQYTRVVHGELTREEIRSDSAWRAWVGATRIAVREGWRERHPRT